MQLENYIKENGLQATVINFKTSTRTVEESVKALKCEPENIIKSIVLETDTHDFYMAILQGNRKIKTKKLKRLLSVKDIRLATPSQVEEQTSYNIGDVPPISVNLPVIIDELVINQNKVYGGGGAPSRLLLLSIEELLDCTHPLIADISVPI